MENILSRLINVRAQVILGWTKCKCGVVIYKASMGLKYRIHLFEPSAKGIYFVDRGATAHHLVNVAEKVPKSKCWKKHRCNRTWKK